MNAYKHAIETMMKGLVDKNTRLLDEAYGRKIPLNDEKKSRTFPPASPSTIKGKAHG